MPNITLSGRPQSRGQLASWYAAALEEQAESGLSVSEYAAELGVTPATLYSWRRRLESRVSERGSTARGRDGLIEIALTDGISPEGGGCFIVRLGDDRSIEVPRGFDEADLRRLVAIVGAC